MNTTTVRSIIKCGFSLYSKDLFVHPSTSRILYNCTSNRNYCAPWSMQSNQRFTFLQPPIGFKQWSVHSCIVSFDHHQRYFSTSLPHSNSQAALKPKSPDRNDDGDKKLKKGTTKSSAGEKVEKQSKGEIETEHVANKTEDVPQIEEKLTLTAKFKRMYKEYWYVLLPVHVVTSCFWFTGFYYLSTSGVDIPALLETMHVSETVVTKLRDSTLGHAAIAYLCYKIATPVRYTVTLGGTTLSIKYLSKWGYIRPVPTKAQLKQMYDDQKAKFQQKD